MHTYFYKIIIYLVNNYIYISKLLNCSFPNINEKCYVCLVTSIKH